MNYPIVQVKTVDNLWLHGLLLETNNSDTIFLHTHGTASNFYEEYFIDVLAEKLNSKEISLLSVNNRGAGVYDSYQKSGASVEKFEDCLLDINAWLEFISAKGYKKVILSGHSLGTEKVVYYMNYGKYADQIKSLVLLAPADSKRYPLFEGREKEEVLKLLDQAKDLVDKGKGDEWLHRQAYAGIMPKSAESFLNFLGSDSKVEKALPFHLGKLEEYSKINIPILAVIGDQKEYTCIPIVDALAMMKKWNQNTEAIQLKDCNHDFEGREAELSNIVVDFIDRNKIV